MRLDEIGQTIKSLRNDRKMTQQELALKCGISRVTLGKIEKGELGNTSVKTLDLILSTLKYEIEFKKITGFGIPTLDEIQQLNN